MGLRHRHHLRESAMTFDAGTVAALAAIFAAIASPIAVVVTLRAQARFSDWRHERHETRLAEHDAKLSEHHAQLSVLEDRGRNPT